MTRLICFVLGILLATAVAACRLDGGQPQTPAAAPVALVSAPAPVTGPTIEELAAEVAALRETIEHIGQDAAKAKGTADMARDTASAAAAVGEAHRAELERLKWSVSTVAETLADQKRGRPTARARRAPPPARDPDCPTAK